MCASNEQQEFTMFFRSLIAIAVLVGLSFPAVADETTIRQIHADYESRLSQIKADWEIAARLEAITEAEEAYYRSQDQSLDRLRRASLDLFILVLEAEYRGNWDGIRALISTYDEVRKFYEEERLALTTYNNAMLQLDQIIKQQHSTLDKKVETLSRAALEEYISRLNALIEKE